MKVLVLVATILCILEVTEGSSTLHLTLFYTCNHHITLVFHPKNYNAVRLLGIHTVRIYLFLLKSQKLDWYSTLIS